MKKMKVIIPVLIVVFVLVAAFGAIGSGAWYKDTGTSAGNVITGGTLDLTIDDNNGATVPMKMSADKLAPGEYRGAGVVTIKNIGNLPGKLSVNVLNIKNNENGVSAPEIAAGESPNNIVGDLGPMLSVIVKQNFAPYDSFQYMTGLSDGATLSTSTMTGSPQPILQPGESMQFQLNTQWNPTDHDNLAQGDSVNFDLQFVLDQIH